MAFRTGPVFKIGSGTQPQPMYGSWVTAGAGFTAPASMPITLTLGTAANAGNDASQIFVAGEYAWLIDPSGVNGETVLISAVANNTVTLGTQTRVGATGNQPIVTQYGHVAGALGTGTFIMPKFNCNNFLIQYEDGGTGPWLYIGNSPVMTAVYKRIFKLAAVGSGVQPQYFSSALYSPGDPIELSELWVLDMTAGDKWNVSIGVA